MLYTKPQLIQQTIQKVILAQLAEHSKNDGRTTSKALKNTKKTARNYQITYGISKITISTFK